MFERSKYTHEDALIFIYRHNFLHTLILYEKKTTKQLFGYFFLGTFIIIFTYIKECYVYVYFLYFIF